ncbi:MAG: LytTR family DNA-binding domain-containing protein [Gammaproteobacteria bacterium]
MVRMLQAINAHERSQLLRRQDSTPIAEPPSRVGPTFKLLMGEREHRLYPLYADSIDYIESEGNYVTIHVGAAKYLSRDSIKRLAGELAANGFIRIQRSLLLNIRSISYVEAVGRGTFAFTLCSGACLQSSASYRDAIFRALPMRRIPSRRQPA